MRRAALAVAVATVLLAVCTAESAERATVQLPLADGSAITGQLYRPEGAGPFPAIVALHGCGGFFASNGTHPSKRHADWAQRLAAAGYVVLFPDSFSARGLKAICRLEKRPVTARSRAGDAAAAADWLSAQSFVDAARLGLLGWSHGGLTALYTVRAGFMAGPARFKTAIAFYPGCREILRQSDWRPGVPLKLLHGAADDWTDPAPCRELAERAGFPFIGYAGAYHDFDAPDTPVRVLAGLSHAPGGSAHAGTDPAARAAAIEEVMSTFKAALGTP